MSWYRLHALGGYRMVLGAHQQGKLLHTQGWEPGMVIPKGWAFYIWANDAGAPPDGRFGPFTVDKAGRADKDGMASLQISPELKDLTANGALIFDAEE